MFLLLSCLVILFLILGCTDERKTKLERGIGMMRSFTGENPAGMLAVATYNADSNPDGLIMLYHANAPQDGGLPSVYSDRQNLQPWSLLVLPGNKERTMIVEAYGEDLKKPIIVEELVFKKRNIQ